MLVDRKGRNFVKIHAHNRIINPAVTLFPNEPKGERMVQRPHGFLLVFATCLLGIRKFSKLGFSIFLTVGSQPEGNRILGSVVK